MLVKCPLIQRFTTEQNSPAFAIFCMFIIVTECWDDKAHVVIIIVFLRVISWPEVTQLTLGDTSTVHNIQKHITFFMPVLLHMQCIYAFIQNCISFITGCFFHLLSQT